MLTTPTLLGNQSTAHAKITHWLESKDRIFILAGFAGTGKTHLCKEILKLCDRKRMKYALLAPTHKACYILRNKSGRDTKTIHSYFKAEKDYDEHGNIVFTLPNHCEIDDDIIIIDEASMIGQKEYDTIMHYLNLTKDFKILFIGDPCQINPVNEEDSPVFTHKDKYQNYFMTEIIRQGSDSGIIPLSKAVRDNIDKDFPYKIKPGKFTHVYPYSGDEIKSGWKLMDDMFTSNDYDTNPDYCKIIAWTNQNVVYFNNHIRKLLFGAQPKWIEENENLVADTPIFGKNFYCPINDVFRIINYRDDRLREYGFKIIRCDITYEDNEGEILVLPKESEEMYKAVRQEKRDTVKYWKNQLRIGTAVDRAAALENFEEAKRDLGKFNNMFTRFKHNHAITAHKSQGSTYEHVFILAYDLERNPVTIERNRIFYTAITRASKAVYVLR